MKLLLLLLLPLNFCLAKDYVTILASDSIPPYVMGEEVLGKELPGLQVEIVNSAFERIGLKTVWKTMPNYRIAIQYKNSDVDAALNLPDLTKVKTNSSSELVKYRNCVIGPSKYKNTWKQNASSLKIVGFQTAKHVFKNVFGENVLEKNQKYNEVTSQKTIAYHAVNGRADLVLSDAYVFSYYAQTYFAPQFAHADLMCLYELEISRHLGLKDKSLRDRFNNALNTMKVDGTYDAIVKKYQSRFSLLSKLESTHFQGLKKDVIAQK